MVFSCLAQSYLHCDVEKRAAWENRQDRSAYNVKGYADANWAGCKVCLCKVQTTIAMNSAESEL